MGEKRCYKQYRALFVDYAYALNGGDAGACWDNAVVERFFGSLKHY